MAKIALYIKTFLRNPCLTESVDSILEHASALDYRIYVVDDGRIDEDRARLYERLEALGHEIIRLPFDVGASAARNMGLRQVSEPFVLRMDDDFVFTPRTRVDRMLEVLDRDERVGAVSDLEVQRHGGRGLPAGEVSDAQGTLAQVGTTLWKVPLKLENVPWRRAGEVRYAPCEFCRNFLLIRRELLDHLRWDYRLKIRGEHIDFMLQIVRQSDWELAFTPDSQHVHAGPSLKDQPETYAEFRYRDGGFLDILYSKWGFRKIMIDRPGGSPNWLRRWRVFRDG